MTKYSVKKPFTVVVAVIMIIVLGIVCIPKMQTDLLPEFSLPYMIIVTTDPGASPEKVEAEVSAPIESSLGTVDGVENITSSSYANYSMVMLEFSGDTNMDSALVRVSSALNMLSLPETCGTPNIMELSMDMMATMYASVTIDGKDILEISDFTDRTVIPYFERQDGVASVSPVGLVEQTVEVRLDQSMIDAVNKKILAETNEGFREAQEKIDDGKSEIADAKSEIESQTSALSSSQTEANDQLSEALSQMDTAKATKAAYEANLSGLETSKTALEAELQAYHDANLQENYDLLNTTFGELNATMGAYASMAGITIPQSVEDAIANPEAFEAFKAWIIGMGYGQELSEVTAESLIQLSDVVNTRIPQINTELSNLSTEIMAANAAVDAVNETIADIDRQYSEVLSQALSSASTFGSAQAQLSSAKTQLETAESELEDAQNTLDESMENVLKNANLDALLTLDTLSSLIYAQNFSMPAGYIDDKNDDQWLLTVGDSFEKVEDIRSMTMADIDGVGQIKLSDVASVVIVDNAMESYARMNGSPAVILSIFKSSTASTSDVSDLLTESIEELEAKYPTLSVIPISDQGDFIDLFLSSILSSLLSGAGLAILVLVLFLKDVKPTLVVAFSIPFSVMTAIVIMYFSGITLNVMSLAGLALAIGMLVDNSIVVMENIYRLRTRGISAARAAVQGTKQVAGAIFSSTATTVCVFLPMVFTMGMIQDILVPFALTISYALAASLLIAVTVVPTMSSTLLKNAKPKSHKWFDKLVKLYEKVLVFSLKRKWVPLLLAVALLVFSVYEVSRMGMSMMGDMGSNMLSVSVTVPEGTEKEESFQMADDVSAAILSVEGIQNVGVMDQGSSANLLVNSGSSGSEDFNSYTYYITCHEDITSSEEIDRIIQEMEEKTADLPCEVNISSASSMELTALAGSGLSVNIYGADTDTLMTISEDLCQMMESVNGIKEASYGLENADEELHLVIDKDFAMSKNLTVAQIFQTLAGRITTEKAAAQVTIDGYDMSIQIVDETDRLTVENLMDTEFEVVSTDSDGKEVTTVYTLDDFANIEHQKSADTINRENLTRYMTVTGTLEEGENSVLVSRSFEKLLNDYEVPSGYAVEISGEVDQVLDMVSQLLQALLLGFVLIYLIMVAQFQSILSPFIVIFTIPLAFTGGLIAMLIAGEEITAITLLGFMVLMGTVVNNGIVFVDYTNQLRIQGLSKYDALIAAGKTRMRPILMTALTTILSMISLAFSSDVGAQMSRGMAVVVMGGLLYSTLMTLIIVPIMYDIFYRKTPKAIDLGSESLDDIPDDAAEYMEEKRRLEAAEQGE